VTDWLALIGKTDIYMHPLGPHTYHVCDTCNYGEHRCGGCGDDINHGMWACRHCREEFGPQGYGGSDGSV